MSFNSFLSEISQYEIAGDDRVYNMLEEYRRTGDLALRDAILKSNMRLVLKIAQEYAGKGVEMEDLVSLGNCGLLYAIDKYDLEKRGKFSVYASLWIRNYMRRKGLGKKHITSSGEWGFSNSRGRKYKLERLSLDQPAGDDEEDRTIGELIADETKSAAERVADNDAVKLMMSLVERILNENERKVITARYLDQDADRRVNSLAEELGLTHQRISQLEKSALAKLREAMA